MDCPACHAPNPDVSRFCSHCGQLMEPPRASVPPIMPAVPLRPQQAPAYAGPPVGAAAMPSPGAAAASGLIQRILNITLKPASEWQVIAAEPPSMSRIVVGCVVPLAAIQAVLSFVHMAVIGVSVPFAGNVRMPMAGSLTAALMGFVFSIIGMFLLALIVNVWAPFFNGRRSLPEALKVAAYTAVPGWVGAFFGILPVLGALIGLVAAIYCIYVLYLGLPIVMRAPKERATGYTVAVILSGILLGIVLGGVMFASRGAMMPFGMPRPSADAQAEQGAAITGSILGNMLGTDDQGKAALGQAIGNLARAGQQMEDAQRASASQQPAQTPAANVATPMNADQAASAGAAVGSLLTALGGALGGSHRVAPVDFRTLQGLLPPSVDGMPRGATEGENNQAMGVRASSAGAVYTGTAGSNIHIKISDVSGVSGLLDIAGNLDHTTDSESSTGFERDVTVGGHKVHEKFSNAGKQGEVQVIVAKRFTVDVDGSGVDMAALEQALGQVDLGRLESMKNANAQN